MENKTNIIDIITEKAHKEGFLTRLLEKDYNITLIVQTIANSNQDHGYGLLYTLSGYTVDDVNYSFRRGAGIVEYNRAGIGSLGINQTENAFVSGIRCSYIP
jgi:hypothetical protein